MYTWVYGLTQPATFSQLVFILALLSLTLSLKCNKHHLRNCSKLCEIGYTHLYIYTCDCSPDSLGRCSDQVKNYGIEIRFLTGTTCFILNNLCLLNLCVGRTLYTYRIVSTLAKGKAAETCNLPPTFIQCQGLCRLALIPTAEHRSSFARNMLLPVNYTGTQLRLTVLCVSVQSGVHMLACRLWVLPLLSR
jgi:hypothetical protein